MENNMKKKKILIAGGDMRQLYCAVRLSCEFDTAVIGFDREHLPEELHLCNAKETECGTFDYAVLPVPPLDDGGRLLAPCYSQSLLTADAEKMLAPDGIIFAGRADDRLREAFPGREICDYLLREELSLKNAIPTAEGALQLALDELPVTMNGLRVLIVGMGRIGTALTEILKGFGADITVAVRNGSGAARARLHGVSSVSIKEAGSDYGLVFNTVPSLVFDRELLSRFSKSTLFIDLASKPGGIDFDAALELGIKVIWALGLPGKTAPVTSGEFIAETVMDMIAERGERSE